MEGIGFTSSSMTVPQAKSSLADRLFGPAFEPLHNPAEFAKVFVDEFAIAWPCGADLSPDAIYQRLTAPVLS